VLLRQQAGDGVDVLAVAGTVTRDDTPALLSALRDVVSTPSRGVLVDLSEVTDLDPVAAAALHVLSARAALGLWLDVECGPQGPRQARRAVAECAARLGLDEVSDDLLLLVSEMVTNAVRHGAPPVRLEVLADDDVVRVTVGDGDPGLPRPREVDEEAEGGRGMVLVELLASEHGVRSQPPGKTVWASVTRSGGPRP
jgi:anti-sigma regulatory factor (Ser/Thr protein kinase)/ABC-type transporter Mla MlaB component